MRFVIIGYGNWGSRAAKAASDLLDRNLIFIISATNSKKALSDGFNIIESIEELNNNDKCYITSSPMRHFEDIKEIRKTSFCECLVEKPFVTSLEKIKILQTSGDLTNCYSAQVHRFMNIIRFLTIQKIKPYKIVVKWADISRSDLNQKISYHLDILPHIIGIIDEVIGSYHEYNNIKDVFHTEDNFKCLIINKEIELEINISRNCKERKRIFEFYGEKIYFVNLDHQTVTENKRISNKQKIEGGGLRPMLFDYIQKRDGTWQDKRVSISNAYKYLKACDKISSLLGIDNRQFVDS
ncbi:Gfo/Idh/MocA family oxidoreductase [Prochlorococcus sp. MIT 1341]|uniref:Gfo/Idh/MocA family oxidoreductase n=1 Tax=Prochlorococcus sp. MIT 1341 TaxID=3096221 RepID=UPI002A75E253|nr:Gfo/Idh/MocA family oxidoreductase [Prochlorococcus sp. MIT 1341]